MKIYLILKGSLRSLIHAGYQNEQEVRNEVQRLESIRLEENNRIETNPSKGYPGACFMNVKDIKPWSYEEVEV